ncbi:MAG: CopD family protein [Pseudomonadota bacterium]|nr:CopD family protein [Pseudomonadota bacterium]
MLVAGAGTVRHAAVERGGRLEQARYVAALSHPATLALVGIAASGVYAARSAPGTLDNLTGNPYSAVLLVKLSLVATAALLGGATRFVVMPGLLAGLREDGNARVLQLEALVQVAVLVGAVMLSSTAPPSAA